MNLAVRKEPLHEAYGQQIKVRNVIIEGPSLPNLQLHGAGKEDNEPWCDRVTFYRKVLMGRLHEITSPNAPYFLCQSSLMNGSLFLEHRT